MLSCSRILTLKTYGPNKLFDITSEVEKIAQEIRHGLLILQAKGSTGAIVLLPDDKQIVSKFEHDLWDLLPVYGWRHPGNAYAHLRSTLLKTILVIPIIAGEIEYNAHIFFLENQATVNKERHIIVLAYSTISE